MLLELHPAGKVLCCCLLVEATLAVRGPGLTRLAAPGAVLVLLWLAAGLPPGLLLRRLALAFPFVLLAAMSLPFMGRPEAHAIAQWGPFTVTREGLLALESVLARATLCLLALSLLGAVTPPHDLLAALRCLRVPGLLVTVLSLTVRYLGLLAEEAGRMGQARDARGIPRSLHRRARVAGHMIGALFLRSWERAERVGQAMTARGFSGTLPVIGHQRWRVGDYALVACVLAGSAVLVLA